MPRPYWEIVSAGWVVFWLYWMVSGLRVRAARRKVPFAFTATNTALLYVGFVLVLVSRDVTRRFSPLVTSGDAWVDILGTMLAVAGVALAVWSRAVLGTNWSSTVRIMQGQRLVTNGPYAVVRNPIYSGMALALLGTALVSGTAASMSGFVLAFLSLWQKGRVEERLLLEEFGDEYATYKRRVRSMIPSIL